jgi:hypothetical protein
MCHRKAHSLEGAVEILGHDASSTNDRHHVGVTAPPGNHVEVEMLLDSGPGCFTDVETNVESVRAVAMRSWVDRIISASVSSSTSESSLQWWIGATIECPVV